MAETTEKKARPKVEAVPEDLQREHQESACPVAWCPVCLAVTAVQPLKPDVVEHLLKAGSELLLAFRAVVDARADEFEGKGEEGAKGGRGSARLEKIDLG